MTSPFQQYNERAEIDISISTVKWKPCHGSEIISLPKYLVQNILLKISYIKFSPRYPGLRKVQIYKNLTESRNLDLEQTVILDEFWQSQVSTCKISNYQEFDRVRSGLVKISK